MNLKQWKRMVAQLESRGMIVEDTCDELGRVASWVDVAAAGPLSERVA